MAILARVDTRMGTNKPWSGRRGGSLSKRGSLRSGQDVLACNTNDMWYTRPGLHQHKSFDECCHLPKQ